jgi:hypothetical protein
VIKEFKRDIIKSNMNKSSQSVIFVLILLLILLISPFRTDASTEVTLDIDSPTTWTEAGSPYVVLNSVSVFPDTTLTIEPGTIVKFEQDVSLDVLGSLISSGTSQNPIYFTSYRDDSVGGDSNGDGEDSAPSYADWSEIYLEAQGVVNFSNVIFKYANDTVYAYNTDVNFTNINCSYANSCITISDGSSINVSGSSFSHLYKEAMTIFNNSTATLTNNIFSDFYENGSSFVDSLFTVFNQSSISFSNSNISGFHSLADLLVVFNDSSLQFHASNVYFSGGADAFTFFNNVIAGISDLVLMGGAGNGITMFNNSDVNLSRVEVKNFAMNGIDEYGSSSGYNPNSLTLNDVVISGNNIGLGSYSDLIYSGTDVEISNNTTYGSFLYSSGILNLPNIWWGSNTGPYHEISNPLGTGNPISDGIIAIPYTTEDIEIPNNYYSKITNIPEDVAELYDSPSKNSTLVKTLPNDWIIKVISKFDNNNQPMIADGYNWYKIEDPTDSTQHYMISGTGNNPIYLPYDQIKQTEYENKSKDNLSGDNKKVDRRQVFLDALDHYYNNNENTKSLYSGNDIIDIKKLKEGSFPKEVILAMVAQEIGSSKFNNEIVSFDYGHGMMQVTMDAYAHEDPSKPKSYGYNRNGDDPRGFYSKVILSKCKEINSDQYKKCYENTNNFNKKLKPYSNYDHNPANPKFKQYANTVQSIYSNIKDGLGILVGKYKMALRNSCEDGDYTVEGYTFTCSDLIKVKTVWFYNGKSFKDSQNYMKDISNQLKVLDKTFPGVTYANTDNLIEKLAIANRHRIQIDAHSPIEVRVRDSQGNIVGLVNGEAVADIPNGAYDQKSERAVIFFPNDTYTYQVVGDDTGGTYGLDVNTVDGNNTTSFEAENIPIVTDEIHTYSIDQQKLEKNDPDAVTIKIDTNGDGVVERIIQTGNDLSSIHPYDFYFKRPLIDNGAYKTSKELPIKIRVTSENKKKVPLQHPWLKITRMVDGYNAPINPNIMDEDGVCESDDECFTRHHNRYILKLPKNFLTPGQWKVEVGLDDVIKHSIIINMVI